MLPLLLLPANFIVSRQDVAQIDVHRTDRKHISTGLFLSEQFCNHCYQHYRKG
jgi:hypothetical protein